MTDREEYIVERAAIREFDGEMSRQEAEREAERDWHEYQRENDGTRN